MYRDSLADEIAYVLSESDARVVLVEGQEQLDRVLEIIDKTRVEKIIVDEAKGLHLYREKLGDQVITFSDLLKTGKALDEQSPGIYDELVRDLDPDDVAGFFTTSGTTGRPKLAMLSHRNLLAMAYQLNKLDPIEEDWEYVSFLPPAWVGEQMMSIALHFMTGFRVNFPESETLWRDFREIAPHFLFAPPRIWERIARDVMADIRDSDPVKRLAYEIAILIGYRAAKSRLKPGKRRPSLGWRILRYVAYWLALRSILDKKGLKRVRRAYTGGAMLGPDYFLYFHALSVNLKQIYGQTEVAGIAVVHPDDDVRPETVGKPLPETELRISEDGEILIRSPAVMKGYYRNPGATRKTIDPEGWLHTGDIGEITSDGHLVVHDRAKEIITLSNGTKVAPQVVQNKLKFSPYIAEAAVIGENRPYLIAILNIDYPTVSRWAEHRGIAFTSYSDLSQKPEVLSLLREEVMRANRSLHEEIRVRRFVSLFKEFHPDDGEMTRTRKLRRRVIEQRYKELIEAMYRGDDEALVCAEIRLEDGRRIAVERKVRIITV